MSVRQGLASTSFGKEPESLLDGAGIHSQRQRKPLPALHRETLDDHPDNFRTAIFRKSKNWSPTVPGVNISIDQESSESKKILI